MIKNDGGQSQKVILDNNLSLFYAYRRNPLYPKLQMIIKERKYYSFFKVINQIIINYIFIYLKIIREQGEINNKQQ